MALHDFLENLRARPRNEQAAIAGLAAITVMAVLFIGWSVYFFKKIRNSNIDIEPPSINLGAVNEAREQLLGNFYNATDAVEGQIQN